MKKANGTRAEKKTTLRKAGKASRQARRATAYTLPNGTRAEIRETKYFIDGRKVKKIEFQTAVYAGFGIKTVITGKNADVIHLVCEPLNTEVVPVLKNGNTKMGCRTHSPRKPDIAGSRRGNHPRGCGPFQRGQAEKAADRLRRNLWYELPALLCASWTLYAQQRTNLFRTAHLFSALRAGLVAACDRGANNRG